LETRGRRGQDLNGALIVTDNSWSLDVPKAIRAPSVRMTLVFDEYGQFEGIITSGAFGFEVVDLDGRRIDKLLVSRVADG
jgi:CBS domain containing-hemolysin-like protein